MAPLRLRSLATLIVKWNEAAMARKAEAALAPLLPGVRLVSVDTDESVGLRNAWSKDFGIVLNLCSHGPHLENVTHAPFRSYELCPQQL